MLIHFYRATLGTCVEKLISGEKVSEVLMQNVTNAQMQGGKNWMGNAQEQLCVG